MTDGHLRPLCCSQCGAALTVGAEQRLVTCPFCQQSHVFVPPPPAEPEGTAFEAGDAVAVKWQGRWWPATVASVEGGRAWRIHYDGWSERHDEIVGPERIRHRDRDDASPLAARPSRGAAAAGRSTRRRWVVALLVALGLVLFLVARNAARSPSRRPAEAGDVSRHYERGALVDILWQERWWPGRILEVQSGGQYRVSYDGWTSEWDETVTAARLRPRSR